MDMHFFIQHFCPGKRQQGQLDGRSKTAAISYPLAFYNGRLIKFREAVDKSRSVPEIAAQVMENAFFSLDAPVKRLTPPFTPVPFGRQFDAYLYPNEDKIVQGVKELLA